MCGERELRTEGVESGRVWTELSECVVLGELSEECTRGRAGGAHVAREAREARGSRNARGSGSARRENCGSTRQREVATFFLSFFSFGFMCKCLWEAPVGDTLGSFTCCRVSA